jgi:hypothetical protein
MTETENNRLEEILTRYFDLIGKGTLYTTDQYRVLRSRFILMGYEEAPRIPKHLKI